MNKVVRVLALGASISVLALSSAFAAEGKVIKWFEFYSIGADAAALRNSEWVDMVISQFEAENPGWTVERESALWDQLDQRSILDYNAGIPHDVMFSSPQLMAKHNVAGDYIDLTPFINASWSEDEQNDLNWSAGWQSATFGEKQLAIPLGIHIRVNAYNLDLFEAAGLDPNKALTSPDEVLAAGKALTKDGVWGLGLFMGNSRATIELTYAPLVWHYGGDFYDSDAGKATLASAASVKAVEWLYDAVHTAKITPPFAYASDADYGNLVNAMFVNGQAAQTMGFGSYWIADMEAAGMVSGCFPATAGCKIISGSIMVSPSSVSAQFANSWNLSINTGSEHPEMAFELINVALRSENLAVYPDAGLPARLSEWSKPEYSSEFWQIWAKAAQTGRSMPQTAYYPELADVAAAAIQEALTGDRADILALLTRVDEEWNRKYAD